jgi:DNA repair photolyase
MAKLDLRMIQVKSVVTAQSASSSMPFDFGINPYRGCQFGCSYCYASKFVHDDVQKKRDWGFWVEAKANAVDALQRESHKLLGSRIFFSSATDPYQPAELKLGLTRAMLEVLLMAFPQRLHIQTRSPHVIRDIDLLQKLFRSRPTATWFARRSSRVRRRSGGGSPPPGCCARRAFTRR